MRPKRADTHWRYQQDHMGGGQFTPDLPNEGATNGQGHVLSYGHWGTHIIIQKEGRISKVVCCLSILESTNNTKQVPPTTHFRIVTQNKRRKMVHKARLEKQIQPNTNCTWPRMEDCL